MEAQPQQVTYSSSAAERKPLTAEAASSYAIQSESNTTTDFPPSILIHGYHHGLLDLQQLVDAKTCHPLTNLETVRKIKRKVAKAHHPDKVGADAKDMYQTFNARVDELLKPGVDETAWLNFNKVLELEVVEAVDYLSCQVLHK